jgi:hypothetical protein
MLRHPRKASHSNHNTAAGLPPGPKLKPEYGKLIAVATKGEK